jgi:hypothetical protein
MSKKQVHLNSNELKGFLTHMITNNRFLEVNNKKKVAVEIMGESGLGKTSVALQLANELNLNFVKLNLSQIEELGDLVGFPVRQFELCKYEETVDRALPVTETVTKTVQIPVTKTVKKFVPQMVTKTGEKLELVTETVMESKTVKKQVLENGRMTMKEVTTQVPVTKEVEKMVPYEYTEEEQVEVEVEETVMIDDIVTESVTPGTQFVQPTYSGCIWVDEQATEEYTKRGYNFTGNKRMSYCPPEWIANKEGGGILIIDDYNRADLRFLQAIMELVDRGEYISWKLPSDWHIILTANPDNGNYLVNAMDNAQTTRFVSVNLKWDSDCWAQWAEKDGVDTRCINFVLLHPDMIQGDVNPRSVTNFFNCISSLEDFSKELPLVQMIGEGSAGSEFTTMFTMFINNNLDKIVNPKEILFDDNEGNVIKKMRDSFGRGTNYRADIASVVTARLINYTLYYSESNSITQPQINRLIRICTEREDFLSADLQYVIVKKLLAGNKQKFQKLLVNPEVITMASK